MKEIEKITGFLIERLTKADYYLNLPPLHVAVSVTDRLVQQNVLWPRIVHTEDEEVVEYHDYATLLQCLVSRFRRDVLIPMFNYIILRRPSDGVLTQEGKPWLAIRSSDKKKTANSYDVLVNKLSKEIQSWLQTSKNDNKKTISDIHTMNTTSDEQQSAIQYVLAIVSRTLSQKNHVPGNVKIAAMLKSKLLYSPVEKFLLEHFRETQKPNQHISSMVLRTALDAFRLVFKDAAETKLVNFLIQELPKPVIQQTIVILHKEALSDKPVMTEAFLTALKKKYDVAASSIVAVVATPAVAVGGENKSDVKDPTRRRDTRPANIVDFDDEDEEEDEAAYARELAEAIAVMERDKGKEEKKKNNNSSSSSSSNSSKKRKPEEEKKKAEDQMDEREDEEKHTKPSKSKKQKRVHFELDEE